MAPLRFSLLLFSLLQRRVFAAFSLPGSKPPVGQVLNTFVDWLSYFSLAFCTVIFAIGALTFAFGGAKEDLVEKGKVMMIGSLIGLAVVIGAVAIMRTFFSIFT